MHVSACLCVCIHICSLGCVRAVHTYVQTGMVCETPVVQQGDVLLLPLLAQRLAALLVENTLQHHDHACMIHANARTIHANARMIHAKFCVPDCLHRLLVDREEDIELNKRYNAQRKNILNNLGPNISNRKSDVLNTRYKMWDKR